MMLNQRFENPTIPNGDLQKDFLMDMLYFAPPALITTFLLTHALEARKRSSRKHETKEKKSLEHSSRLSPPGYYFSLLQAAFASTVGLDNFKERQLSEMERYEPTNLLSPLERALSAYKKYDVDEMFRNLRSA